jgi:hypothetical protein
MDYMNYWIYIETDDDEAHARAWLTEIGVTPPALPRMVYVAIEAAAWPPPNSIEWRQRHPDADLYDERCD